LYDIKGIFGKVSKNLSQNEKNFTELVLNNSAITEIVDNSFEDITFKRFHILNATNLKRIHANAFGSIAESIEEFLQEGSSDLGEEQYSSEMFSALNSLTNVIHLIFDETKLTKIPENAFNTTLKSLYRLGFSYNGHKHKSINRIENYAFEHLNNLEYLYLYNHKIDYLTKHAFDFGEKSDKLLNIYLDGNNLNATSFELGVFLGSKRPLFISLFSNHLEYLDQKIFEPILLLDQRNKIHVFDNPLKCDCRMFWMYKKMNVLQNQFINVNCIGSKTLWAMNATDFDQCGD